MAIETVCILGAGASKADGAPLQRDLFSEYHRSLNEPESAWAEMDKEIVAFFQAFFGIDFAKSSPRCECGMPFDHNRPYKPYPTFEEVLGIIEIALDRGESFPDFDVTPQNPRLQRMQGQLIDLIANMLGNIGRTGAAYHRKLANSLHKQGSLLSTGFISLNYDTIVDSALEDLGDIDLDYGVDFATVEADEWRRELLTARWQKPRPERSVALYKLHGSLNWLYCPRCTALIIVPRHFPFAAPINVDCPCSSATTWSPMFSFE